MTEPGRTPSGGLWVYQAALELASKEEHQVVVIGSGPGAALAAVMLAKAGLEILVLEEGDFYPVDSVRQFSVNEMQTKYRNGGLTMALGNPIIQFVEGRCLGGGSEINSGLHHRLPDEVVWRWSAEQALPDLTPASLRDCFEAVEKELSVSLMPSGTVPLNSLVIKEGADTLGWNCLEVPRWRQYTPENPVGYRQTMTETFLPQAQKAGARIVCGAKVERLEYSCGAWKVDVRTGGPDNLRTIRAETVFLGAGAIGSSVILKRSGLGEGRSPGLHLHPTVKIVAQFDREINQLDSGVPVHQVKEFGSGMSIGGSISSPHYLAVSMASRPGGLAVVRDKWPCLAVYYATVVPEGRGSVTVLPGFSEPVVRYRLTKRDLAALTLALKRLGRLLLAAGAQRLYPSVLSMPPLDSPSALEGMGDLIPAKALELMTIHLTSTNAMSGTPILGMVDEQGRVWGTRGLYVCDASILCSAPGVNPQGPLMALVRRNTARYLGD
ncbi:MAG: GMC family oxidoreductase [Deltaproteobacteria bacterium]|jgi:choline dehydrogenase-like flavoprotein|nr:GMC family oxidoreductase [Deltaproteobacteria bacterium]